MADDRLTKSRKASKNDPPDILARTFAFGERVSALCDYLRRSKVYSSDRTRQLDRAASSVGALVEEAQGAESRKDFVHKLSIAQKEARESFYWLRRVLAAKVLPERRLEGLVDEARQIKLVLAAIINSTKRNASDDKNDDSDE